MAAPAKKPKRKDVHERALGLLAVRARSRRELERRLLQAGFEAEEIGDELIRLEEVGLVDDEAFAREVARHAFGRGGKGRRAVASALAAKGVSSDVAALVLDEAASGDEDERALELAQARAGRLSGVDAQKAFQRLSSLLMRRGFAPDVSRSAARKALTVDVLE